jgi:hypothetical protein
MKKKFISTAITVTLILISALVSGPQAASAADSVSVPGQVGVDQCPAGYQYSTGISVNVSTGVYTTICNAPPNESDLLLQQQDADFRSQIDAAQSAAEAQSRAWNEANPGQQKCIQWGPITHANGVSTSSGGVCANPIALGEGQSTPSLDAEDVVATVPVLSPNQNIIGSGEPFYKEVSGQVGIEGCPAGYQGANGLTVNATTGLTTTQCWTTEAWAAYRLGGIAWDKYQATGGGYDVAAELDRREKLEQLISQAKTVAQNAANQTPGVRRCSSWSGYGEKGSECAYAFVDPDQVVEGVESSESTDAVDPPTLESPALVTASSIKILSKSKLTTTVKSLSPKICTVNKLKITKLKKGTCNYSVTTKAKNGKKATAKRAVMFIN